MKRPKIQAGETSEENGLGLVTNYELPTELFNSIIGKQDWGISTNQSNLTLTKVETVQNTSKQILSAWGDSYKMKKIATKTSEIDQASTAWKEEIKVTDVLDKKDDINNPDRITFGNGNNNNITRNGTKALRLMLRIIKPTGSLPTWFNNTNFPDNKFFNKSYPLEAAYSGETTFKEIVNDFANEKARLIDLSEANNVAVGLGNLKIDAYLELNPKFASYTDKTGKIYTLPNGGKGIVDKSNANKDQLIIYKDEFTGSRTIYDQSQINYNDFNQGGFGTSTNSSWSDSKEIGDLKNIKVTTDYTQLPDTLVRKPGVSGPLLTFDFKDSSSNLELTPSDSTWFANHFKNYNRLLGLFIKFEYQNAKGQWNELSHTSRAGNNIWTDQEISDNLQQNGNKLLLQNVPQDIKKLRFKLVKNPDSTDQNATINIQNFEENDRKYTSDEFNISVQRIMVDKNWISEVTLSNNESSLANLNVNDITNFEQSVLAKIVNEPDRNQVKLVYEFESNQGLDATQLVQKIQTKFTNFNDQNQGVFALWDGTNGEQLIKAKFVLKNNSNNEFKLVTAQNQNPTEDELSNYVKSNLKSKIDLTEYINQLKSSSIKATMGSQPGTITPDSILIPGKSGTAGSGRFNGKSFEDIKNILGSKGIAIKFKKQEANGGAWSDWLDLQAVTTYATSKPQIQIGFVFDNATKPTNIELINAGNPINDQTAYELKLNLPKVVKAPQNDDQIKNAYNSNPFSGNTKKLIIDKTKLQTAQTAVLNILKTASGNINDYVGLDAVLEFKYQIGDSDFLEADALKTYLDGKPTDQNSNALKLKVNIKSIPNQDPEFSLDQDLATKEFELLSDNNKTIKKWLHGKNFEDELKARKITVTGSKQSLEYKLGPELDKFDKANGKYSAQELVMQYQLLGTNNTEIQAWQDGYLPNKVASNVEKIKVRIAGDSTITDANKIYVYGPEEEKIKLRKQLI